MKSLIISLSMLLTVAAHAESEVIYLPKGGQSALELGYDMGPNTNYDKTGTPVIEISRTSNILNLEYMYGVDDEMSFGASINTGTISMGVKNGATKSTSKYTGTGDLVFKLRMNMGTWFYGADLGLPLAKNIIDADGGNRSSGGMSIVPMGGLLFPNGSLNYGAYASYAYLMDRNQEDKTSTPATTSTVSGGHYLALTPFAEWNFGNGFLTGEFTLRSYADYTTKVNNASTTTKSTNFNTLKIGARYNFTESISGLASYALDMAAANSDSSTPAFNTNTISLGARFVF